MTDTVGNIVQEPPARLVREWAACGIVAAAARFVPVPLLDDAVRGRATRLAVVRTLRAHGRGYDADRVEAVYAGVDGARSGVGRYLRSVPRRVLLFPVRKYVALFGAVKGVPTDVMTVVLLGRSLHRELERGGLADGLDERALKARSVALRRAVDAALDELDLRLISGAVAESLSRGKDLTQAAVERARALVKRDGSEAADTDDLDDLDDLDGAELASAADDVAGALERRDVVTVLAEFDARVDKRLNR